MTDNRKSDFTEKVNQLSMDKETIGESKQAISVEEKKQLSIDEQAMGDGNQSNTYCPKNPTVYIRLAAETDLANIAGIEAKNFSEPWSENGFRDAFHLEDTARIWVAVDTESRLLGYLVLYYTRYEGELETVAVDESARGQGIGHQLIQAMIAFGQEKDLDQIVLEVRKSNQTAIGLYQSQKFQVCGERKRFYRFPEEDALVMMYHYEK